MDGNDDLGASVFKPVNSCLQFIKDEIEVVDFAIRGAYALEASPDIIRIAEKAVPEHGNLFLIIKKITSVANSKKEWIEKQRDGGFETFYRHSLISVWASFESCVEDLFVSIVKMDVEYFDKVKSSFKNWKVSYADMEEGDFHKMYSDFERRVPKNNAYYKCRSVLNIFEIDFVLNDAQSSLFVEANEVRNCLLHRSGNIDAIAIERAPTLSRFDIGCVKVDKIMYIGYSNVVIDVVKQIFVSVMNLIRLRYYKNG
ncbi:hypothetical protein [Desulfolutivibrio sp.]|uniref:hypothetical protein n=1 Tax=Desulfolutivibrio sp. TaxID=2773296 RepID=UPI002F966565